MVLASSCSRKLIEVATVVAMAMVLLHSHYSRLLRSDDSSTAPTAIAPKSHSSPSAADKLALLRGRFESLNNGNVLLPASSGRWRGYWAGGPVGEENSVTTLGAARRLILDAPQNGGATTSASAAYYGGAFASQSPSPNCQTSAVQAVVSCPSGDKLALFLDDDGEGSTVEFVAEHEAAISILPDQDGFAGANLLFHCAGPSVWRGVSLEVTNHGTVSCPKSSTQQSGIYATFVGLNCDGNGVEFDPDSSAGYGYFFNPDFVECFPNDSWSVPDALGHPLCQKSIECGSFSSSCPTSPLFAAVDSVPTGCIFESSLHDNDSGGDVIGTPGNGGNNQGSGGGFDNGSGSNAGGNGSTGGSSTGGNAGGGSASSGGGSSIAAGDFQQQGNNDENEFCDLEGQDFASILVIIVSLLLFGLWLAPIIIISKLPDISSDSVKRVLILGIPATLFEAFSGVAAFHANRRCEEEGSPELESGALFTNVVIVGALSLLLVLIDTYLWWRTATSEDAKTSTTEDIDERAWEIAGAKGTCCGNTWVLGLGFVALVLATVSGWLADPASFEEDVSPLDDLVADDDDGATAWANGVIMIFFAPVFLFLCLPYLSGCPCCIPRDYLSCCCRGLPAHRDPVDGKLTEDGAVYIRYLIVRMVLIDAVGFVFSLVTGSYLAIAFALDEIYMAIQAFVCCRQTN